MLTFDRILNLPSLLDKKSYFLFGPRATGKSFLINQQLSQDSIVFNLLNTENYLKLSMAPYLLEELILGQMQKKDKQIIVIDEIQKIPLLLNEVHRLIEDYRWKFLLTGSSARKLKYGNANLLAGRARSAELFPLCWPEIPHFDLTRYLEWGGLPIIIESDDPREDLLSYINTYLYEEIQAEGFVRNLPKFSSFLQLAAHTNGQIVNYSKIASDVGVSVPTIREYYQILEDTLIGFTLPAWLNSKKRKAASSGKFYLFDIGVSNVLNGIKKVEQPSNLYGRAFEHWMALELRSYLSYRRIHEPLNFWRSQQHHEVDFLVGETAAIEVKATDRINNQDIKNLTILAEEKAFKKYYLVSHDRVRRLTGNIICLFWQDFINELWSDKIL
jgi:uncharacterized protein